jgi:hypothetical protein
MPVEMVRIESFSDGRERRLEFHPVPSTDPAVLRRLECPGLPGEHEVATTFRSSAQRPRTYPEGLPFIPGVKANTNEYPGSDRRPRARWSTFLRSRGIFQAVADQSIDAGWMPDATIDPPSLRGVGRKAFFRRSGFVRCLFQHRLGALRLVELQDVPDHVMDRLTGAVNQKGG